MTCRIVRIAIAVGSCGVLLGLGALPASAGGGGRCAEPLAEGAGTAVEMADACFTPAVLHVGVGDDVTFTNRDPMPHNVAPAGWGWGHVDTLAEGETYVARFTEPGIYPYACSLHAGMTGAVIVGGERSVTTAARAFGEPTGGTVAPWVAVGAGALGVAGGYALAKGRRPRERSSLGDG